jgi:hypothetical protein
MFFLEGWGGANRKGGGVGFLGPKDKPDGDSQPSVPKHSIYKSEFNFAKLLTLLHGICKNKTQQNFVSAKFRKISFKLSDALSDQRTLFLTVRSSLFALFLSLKKLRIDHRF